MMIKSCPWFKLFFIALLGLFTINSKAQQNNISSVKTDVANKWSVGLRTTVNRNAFYRGGVHAVFKQLGELHWATGMDSRVMISRMVYSNRSSKLSIEAEGGYSRFSGRVYGITYITGINEGFFIPQGYEEFQTLALGIGVDYQFNVRNQKVSIYGGLELNRQIGKVVWDYWNYSKMYLPKMNIQLRYVFTEGLPLLNAVYLSWNQTFTRTRIPELQNGYAAFGLGLILRL